MFLIDAGIRRQLILAFTEDSKLHVEEVLYILLILDLPVNGECSYKIYSIECSMNE